MMLCEEMVKGTNLSTRFIVYLYDRAVANSAGYIPLCEIYRGRYCDSLQAGRFGLRALVGPKVLSFQHPSTVAPAPIHPPVQWAPRLNTTQSMILLRCISYIVSLNDMFRL